ncbi:MAG: hypothetical protein RLZZ338_2670 [Cyanobacteriota bacterium]
MVSVTGRDSDVLRNRVSLANLGKDAESLKETRFLNLRRYGICNRARSRKSKIILFYSVAGFFSLAGWLYFLQTIIRNTQPTL